MHNDLDAILQQNCCRHNTAAMSDPDAGMPALSNERHVATMEGADAAHVANTGGVKHQKKKSPGDPATDINLLMSIDFNFIMHT